MVKAICLDQYMNICIYFSGRNLAVVSSRITRRRNLAVVKFTDNETPECKAEFDAKAELTLVSEHFKEDSNAAIWRLVIREQKKTAFAADICRSLQAIPPIFILVQFRVLRG